jgi:hypothetical protein
MNFEIVPEVKEVQRRKISQVNKLVVLCSNSNLQKNPENLKRSPLKNKQCFQIIRQPLT